MAVRVGWIARPTASRSWTIFIGSLCGSAIVAIPVADLLLPASVHVLPLNAIPVLIGSRVLERRGAALLAIGATFAQIGKGLLDRSSVLTVLIAITTVLAVALLGRGTLKRPRVARDGQPVANATPVVERAGPTLIGLSRREKEIVLLTLDGMTAPRITESLFISKRTVETHLANAYVKLGVASKLELVSRGRELTR